MIYRGPSEVEFSYDKDKNIKREYGRNRYHNMFEEGKKNKRIPKILSWS